VRDHTIRMGVVWTSYAGPDLLVMVAVSEVELIGLIR
jgi:hypothetical protein